MPGPGQGRVISRGEELLRESQVIHSPKAWGDLPLSPGSGEWLEEACRRGREGSATLRNASPC